MRGCEGGAFTLGNKVARLGEHFGLSQQLFADLIGVSRSTLASYKNRSNANPSQSKARALSERFGVPFEWFLDGIDSEPPVSKDYVQAEGTMAGVGSKRDRTTLPSGSEFIKVSFSTSSDRLFLSDAIRQMSAIERLLRELSDGEVEIELVSIEAEGGELRIALRTVEA